MQKGTLVLVIGLPGSGKGTLIAYARATFPDIAFPLSWTTRTAREGEREGEAYHFATDKEFSSAVKKGEFLEWVSIDGGRRYGTLKREILDPLQEGKCVIREVEVEGAHHIRELLAQARIVTVFINSDSWDDLQKRMLARAPMSEEELAERKKRYEKEILFKKEADYIVDNAYGRLEEAKREFSDIIRLIQASQ